MKLEGSVEEIKQLFKSFALKEKNTPDAGTTGAKINSDTQILIESINKLVKKN